MTIRDMVKRPDTRRKTERRRFTGEVIRSGRGNLVRWSDLFMAVVIRGDDICVTLSAIQAPVSTNHLTGGNCGARVVGGDVH